MAATNKLIGKILKSFDSKLNAEAKGIARSLTSKLDDATLSALQHDEGLFNSAIENFQRSWNPTQAVKKGRKTVEEALPKTLQNAAGYADDFASSVRSTVGSELSSRVKTASGIINDGSLSVAERASAARNALGSLGGEDLGVIRGYSKSGSNVANNIEAFEARASAGTSSVGTTAKEKYYQAAHDARQADYDAGISRNRLDEQATAASEADDARREVRAAKAAELRADNAVNKLWGQGVRRNLTESGIDVTDAEWDNVMGSMRHSNYEGKPSGAAVIDAKNNIASQRADVQMKNRFNGSLDNNADAYSAYHDLYSGAERMRMDGDLSSKKAYDKYIRREEKGINIDPPETSASKTVDDVMTSKSMSNWIKKNKTGSYDDLVNAINKNSPESVIKDMYGKNPYVEQAMGEGKTFDDFKKLSAEDQIKMVNAGRDLRASNATVMDKLGYNKVPQTVAGIGVTAWMVSRMSESKGQMSNDQLYGGGGY